MYSVSRQDFRIEGGDTGALTGESKKNVNVWRRDSNLAAELLNRGNGRVDLHLTAAFEILKHRGFVPAYRRRAGDPPVRVSTSSTSRGEIFSPRVNDFLQPWGIQPQSGG